MISARYVACISVMALHMLICIHLSKDIYTGTLTSGLLSYAATILILHGWPHNRGTTVVSTTCVLFCKELLLPLFNTNSGVNTT